MATTICMPQLGETVTEGSVAKWLKSVGERVEKYEPFVEVSTDKVNAEVPAPVSGTIRALIVKEGETVPIGTPIAIIDETELDRTLDTSISLVQAKPAPVLTSDLTVHHGVHADDLQPRAGGFMVARGLRGMSPAVRRLAREHAVDLALLHGTGEAGRITAQDVLRAAQAARVSAASATTLTPLTPARRLIAERMVRATTTIPHAWTMVEVDVSQIIAWRAAQKAAFERDRGVPLTLLPFFCYAVTNALRSYPLMNARFTDRGIEIAHAVHLGIAIALPNTLVVPVIRDAGTLTIAGLAHAAGQLITRARAGKLTADDLRHGTFTVNNTGANGSVLSAPIINEGQAGIITMETVVKRPVVLDGDAIAIRSMMNVCLSLDHRVVDGNVANAFLGEVKRCLQAMNAADAL